MSVPPVEPSLLNLYPILWEQSLLLQASTKLAENAQPVSPEPQGQADSSRLYLSTSQVMGLFQKFKMKNLTFEALSSFPLSQLTPAEKAFVLFLRRNEGVFNRLAGLDQVPESLSPKDVELAARLTGDALILSNDDLQHLQETLRPLAANTPANRSLPSQPIEPKTIINLLNRLGPEGMTLSQLTSLQPERMALSPQELAILRFLQSPAVVKLLGTITLPHGGALSPEAIRILTSLIWNPSVYGAAPIVFFQESIFEDEGESHPVMPLEEVVPQGRRSHPRGRSRLPVELHADKIMAVFRKLSPADGHVSLAQLRQYQPEGVEEARVVNTLKQAKIFNVLAELDADGSTLSEDDIKLAMAEGTMILYDPYIMLVIMP